MQPAHLPKSVLVVEDEAPIASAVAARLRADGHRVAIACDGLEALELADELEPDLVVLDLMLPKIDGLEVCRRIQAHRAVPVLMLTAKDTEADLLTGLATGADDYLTKPFSARELAARVNALLRRVDRIVASFAAGSSPIRDIGDVRVDAARRQVTRNNDVVHLTPTEFDLFAHLTANAGAVCTRTDLLAAVWGYPQDAESRTIDSHVRALRRKLGDDLIRTVHGVGYAVNVDGATL
ncbi:MAG: response regulator transcription factor [Acidimicrobiia bacterium]